MKLAIGIPLSHGFPVPAEFFTSYVRLHQSIVDGSINRQLPADLQIASAQLITSGSFPVDVARNEIVASMLDKSAADYLLFLDADMTFPPFKAGDVSLVAGLLRHRELIVTARYHRRSAPFGAVIHVKHRVQDGPHKYAEVHFGQGLIEIERGGAGALLIHRRVLELLRAQHGHNWFRYQRGPEPPHDYTVSEDYWFYQIAREAGFRCYCDWDLECHHIGQFEIDRSWHLPFLEASVNKALEGSDRDRQRLADHLVVAGFPGGLELAPGIVIPDYEVTGGER